MIAMGRRHKVLAAAALWGACAWFVSLDVDFLVANLHNAPHWLLQLLRALFMGVSVAIGYAVYRKYLLEIRTRSEKYAEIREQIRRLLADLLTIPDEDLIRQLHRTIQRIEQVLKHYDPKVKVDVVENVASLVVREADPGHFDAGVIGDTAVISGYRVACGSAFRYPCRMRPLESRRVSLTWPMCLSHDQAIC